jgi:hypothetical protein
MTDGKTELIREEDAGWAELHSILDALSPEDMERPGVTADWTPKDTLAHIACWWAEAACELERMRAGTYSTEKRDIDAMNAEFYEAMKDIDARTVLAELHASRNRALEELGRLPELTPDAEEWFVESGARHYDEHLADLRAFLESRAPA